MLKYVETSSSSSSSSCSYCSCSSSHFYLSYVLSYQYLLISYCHFFQENMFLLVFRMIFTMSTIFASIGSYYVL